MSAGVIGFLIVALLAVFFLLIFGGLVFLLIRIGLRNKENLKKRSVELRALADSMAFDFQERASLDALPAIHEVETFEGTPAFFENLMTGAVEGHRVAVFDFAYTNIGAGTTGTTTSRQTMCLLETGQVELPRFYVRPEGILEKALRFAGRKDIDFPEFPVFSGCFLLFGDEESAIRRVFSPDLVRFFEQNSVLAATASGKNLFVFRSRYVANPHEIKGYISTSLAIARMLASKIGTRA